MSRRAERRSSHDAPARQPFPAARRAPGGGNVAHARYAGLPRPQRPANGRSDGSAPPDPWRDQVRETAGEPAINGFLGPAGNRASSTDSALGELRLTLQQLEGDCGAPWMRGLKIRPAVGIRPETCRFIQLGGDNIVIPPRPRPAPDKETPVAFKPTGVVGTATFSLVGETEAGEPVGSEPIRIVTRSKHQEAAEKLDRQLQGGEDRVETSTTERNLVDHADDYVEKQTGKRIGREGVGATVAKLRAEMEVVRTEMTRGFADAVTGELASGLDTPEKAESFGYQLADNAIFVLSVLVPQLRPAYLAKRAMDAVIEPAQLVLSAAKRLGLDKAAAATASSAMRAALLTGMGGASGVKAVEEALTAMTNHYFDALRARVPIVVSDLMGENPAVAGVAPNRYLSIIERAAASALYGGALDEGGRLVSQLALKQSRRKVNEEYVLAHAVLRDEHGLSHLSPARGMSRGAEETFARAKAAAGPIDAGGPDGKKLAVRQILRAAGDLGCHLSQKDARRLADGPGQIAPVGFDPSVLFGSGMPTHWSRLLHRRVISLSPDFGAFHASLEDGIQITSLTVSKSSRHDHRGKEVISIEEVTASAERHDRNVEPVFGEAGPPRMIRETIPDSFRIRYRLT